MSLSRQVQLKVLRGYQTRVEQFSGRDHLVVPVVALVEGVVHAMNAQVPEFVPAKEFCKAPNAWNGRPLFLGHPVREGQPVSGNTPEILQEECIGRVFNTKILKNKLTMEAWIDIERAAEKAPSLLKRVEDADPIEISVGVFTSADDSKGTHMGKPYEGAWFDIMPDHLALLPETDLGACSLEMGCGVRANAYNADQARGEDGKWSVEGQSTSQSGTSHVSTHSSLDEAKKAAQTYANENGRAVVTHKGKGVSEHFADVAGFFGSAAGEQADEESNRADKASDHANRNYPATNQQKADKHSDAAVAQGKAADAHAAAAKDVKDDEVRRDYHNTMAASHRSRAEGHTKASGIYATIDKPKKKRNMKGAVVNGGLLTRVMSALRGAGFRDAMSTEDMTNNDLLRKLYEALRTKYPNAQYADQYYPVNDPTNVVFSCSVPQPPSTGPGDYAIGYQYKMYDQSFTLDASGVVTLNGEATEVEPVTRYEPINRAASDAEPKAAASAKPCSCQHPTAEEKALMKTKQERVTALIGKAKTFVEADRAMLEAASDEQLTRFEAASEAAPAVPATPAAPAAPAAPVVTSAAPVVEEKKDETKVLAAPTFDQMLQAAAPEVRESIETGIRTAKAKKASTIAALKATGRCSMADEALNQKSQTELDQLVELAGSNVRAAIDYSVMGGPKDLQAKEEVPAPADLGASIRAAREKK